LASRAEVKKGFSFRLAELSATFASSAKMLIQPVVFNSNFAAVIQFQKGKGVSREGGEVCQKPSSLERQGISRTSG